MTPPRPRRRRPSCAPGRSAASARDRSRAARPPAPACRTTRRPARPGGSRASGPAVVRSGCARQGSFGPCGRRASPPSPDGAPSARRSAAHRPRAAARATAAPAERRRGSCPRRAADDDVRDTSRVAGLDDVRERVCVRLDPRLRPREQRRSDSDSACDEQEPEDPEGLPDARSSARPAADGFDHHPLGYHDQMKNMPTWAPAHRHRVLLIGARRARRLRSDPGLLFLHARRVRRRTERSPLRSAASRGPSTVHAHFLVGGPVFLVPTQEVGGLSPFRSVELPRFVQKEKVHRFVYLSPNWFTQITASSNRSTSALRRSAMPTTRHCRRNRLFGARGS